MAMTELLFLALIAALFFKPDELRRAARKMGKWTSEIRKMSREFTSELIREADIVELREEAHKIEKDISREMAALDDPIPADGREVYSDEMIEPEETVESLDVPEPRERETSITDTEEIEESDSGDTESISEGSPETQDETPKPASAAIEED